MPKKIFAVTNVRVGPADDQYFAANSVIDPAKFTKEQLLQLHESGAIEIRVVDEEVAPDGTAVTDVVPESTETTDASTSTESTESTDTTASMDSTDDTDS